MSIPSPKLSASRLINWLILLGYTVAFCWMGDYHKDYGKGGKGIISYDTFEYYTYLPRTFIDGDPFYKDWESNPRWDHAWVQETPGGSERTVKMTMGMSYLYAPFFFATHYAVAPITGYERDGYSRPYQFAIFFSAIFWLGIGLYFLRRLLQRYFTDGVVSITLLAILVGTNIDWYLLVRAGITHPYNLALSAMLMWVVIRWHESPRLKYTIAIGLLIGLMSLIRPVNLLFGLVFLLYGVGSWAAFKQRITMLLAEPQRLAMMAILAFLVWMPQLIFWKMTSGSFFYYTYHDEGFFFSDPQIMRGLFGYRNGWLRYTPMMLIALAGIPVLWIRMRDWFWTVITFMVIFVFVVMSWWCWWYIGYGHRAMIDAYALLAIPFAALLAWISEKRWPWKTLAGMVIVLFIFHNLFQTAQARKGIIHIHAMTERAYWKTFMSLEKPKDYWQWLDKPDSKKAKKGIQAVVHW